MSTAASRQSTAMARPRVGRLLEQPPRAAPPTCDPEPLDSPTSANATSRTRLRAAAAAASATTANVVQSMCTRTLPSWSGSDAGGWARQVVDVARVDHVAPRCGVDPGCQGHPGQRDDDDAIGAGRGQP